VRAGFPELNRAEREFGSVITGYTKMKEAEKQAAAKAGIQLTKLEYTFAEGMQTLINALQAKLTQPALTSVGVVNIQPAAEGKEHRWLLHCCDGKTRSADVIILACSIARQSALVADLDHELADLMMQIPVAGIISLSLGFQRQHVPDIVESQGILLPQKLNKDVLRIDFVSSIFPDRVPPGKVLMRLTMGGMGRKEMLSWEEDALILAARRELRSTLRMVKPPVFCHVQKWPRGLPQYTMGHQGRVAKILERAKRHEGLYLAGNAYHGITLSETASHAERVARTIRDALVSHVSKR
jgi:protoporphyrinogen/coproporphyrinogen III oxidase